MIDTDKIAAKIESCVLMPSETDFLKEHAEKAKCGLIEIGSLYGRSSVILGSVALKKGIPMLCVDKWEDEETYSQWKNNIIRAGLNGWIQEMKMLSKEAWDDLNSEPLDNYWKYDFLFIDGDHSTEAVRYDYEYWAGLVTRPATVVFHDIDNKGVRIVFDEACNGNSHIINCKGYTVQKNIGAVYLT